MDRQITTQKRDGATVPASQDDWDVKKETIRCLYMDDNLPLYQIMALMTWKHAFYAT